MPATAPARAHATYAGSTNRLAALGGGTVAVPLCPKARYQAANATATGANHRSSRRRPGVRPKLVAATTPKKTPIPENISEAVSRLPAANLRRVDAPRGVDKPSSASIMPSPHATEPTKAI